MKRVLTKKFCLAALTLALVCAFAFALAACDGSDPLKDAIGDLQEEIDGTRPAPGDKTVTVYVDEYAITASTDEEHLGGLLRELYEDGRITVLDAPDGPYGQTLKRVECRVTVTENGESAVKVYAVSDEEPGTYVAIYHTVDNPSLKGTDYVTGAIIEKGFFGKTFWYSTLGADSLPLRDGACYRLVVEKY